MKNYRFTRNIGKLDIKAWGLPTGDDQPKYQENEVVPESAIDKSHAQKLLERGLLEVVEDVRGVAPVASIQGVPSSEPGTVERATEDLKRFKEKGTVKQ